MVHAELEVECLKAIYFLTTTHAGKIHPACEVISDSIQETLHFGQEDRMVDKFVVMRCLTPSFRPSAHRNTSVCMRRDTLSIRIKSRDYHCRSAGGCIFSGVLSWAVYNVGIHMYTLCLCLEHWKSPLKISKDGPNTDTRHAGATTLSHLRTRKKTVTLLGKYNNRKMTRDSVKRDILMESLTPNSHAESRSSVRCTRGTRVYSTLQ